MLILLILFMAYLYFLYLDLNYRVSRWISSNPQTYKLFEILSFTTFFIVVVDNICNEKRVYVTRAYQRVPMKCLLGLAYILILSITAYANFNLP